MQCQERDHLKDKVTRAIHDLLAVKAAGKANSHERITALLGAQTVVRRLREDVARHVRTHQCSEPCAAIAC